jgi:hypothetical protein
MLAGMTTARSVRKRKLDLVNAPAIADRVVAEGLVEHMTRQRVIQLANDPNAGFPKHVLTAGRSKLYRWAKVREYFAQRDARPIRRDRRRPSDAASPPPLRRRTRDDEATSQPATATAGRTPTTRRR